MMTTKEVQSFSILERMQGLSNQLHSFPYHRTFRLYSGRGAFEQSLNRLRFRMLEMQHGPFGPTVDDLIKSGHLPPYNPNRYRK